MSEPRGTTRTPAAPVEVVEVVEVVEALRELGYDLYAVVERKVHEYKGNAHVISHVVGTRYRGRGKPPAEVLEAAARNRPYVAAIVCATDPYGACPELPWVARVVAAYRDQTAYRIGRRRHYFTVETVAASIGAACGIPHEDCLGKLAPMLGEVL